MFSLKMHKMQLDCPKAIATKCHFNYWYLRVQQVKYHYIMGILSAI